MAAEKVIILSTHILEEVEAVCSCAVIIARHLLADGTPEQRMNESPEHNAVAISVSGPADLEALVSHIGGLEGVEAVEPMKGIEGELSVRSSPTHRMTFAKF